MINGHKISKKSKHFPPPETVKIQERVGYIQP